MKVFVDFMSEMDATRKAVQLAKDHACAEMRINKWVKLATQRQQKKTSKRKNKCDSAQSDDSPQPSSDSE